MNKMKKQLKISKIVAVIIIFIVFFAIGLFFKKTPYFALLKNNTDFFKADSFPTVPNTNSTEDDQFKIKLDKGWNLVSFPVLTESMADLKNKHTTIKKLFNNKIKTIWEFSNNKWESFDFTKKTGTLNSIKLGKGYWLEMEEETDITIGAPEESYGKECVDADAKDIYKSGICYSDEYPDGATDFCYEKNNVYEFYCKEKPNGIFCVSDRIPCPNGCLNGACIKK